MANKIPSRGILSRNSGSPEAGFMKDNISLLARARALSQERRGGRQLHFVLKHPLNWAGRQDNRNSLRKFELNHRCIINWRAGISNTEWRAELLRVIWTERASARGGGRGGSSSRA